MSELASKLFADKVMQYDPMFKPVKTKDSYIIGTPLLEAKYDRQRRLWIGLGGRKRGIPFYLAFGWTSEGLSYKDLPPTNTSQGGIAKSGQMDFRTECESVSHHLLELTEPPEWIQVRAFEFYQTTPKYEENIQHSIKYFGSFKKNPKTPEEAVRAHIDGTKAFLQLWDTVLELMPLEDAELIPYVQPVVDAAFKICTDTGFKFYTIELNDCPAYESPQHPLKSPLWSECSDAAIDTSARGRYPTVQAAGECCVRALIRLTVMKFLNPHEMPVRRTHPFVFIRRNLLDLAAMHGVQAEVIQDEPEHDFEEPMDFYCLNLMLSSGATAWMAQEVDSDRRIELNLEIFDDEFVYLEDLNEIVREFQLEPGSYERSYGFYTWLRDRSAPKVKRFWFTIILKEVFEKWIDRFRKK